MVQHDGDCSAELDRYLQPTGIPTVGACPSNPVVEIVDLKSIQRQFESVLGYEATLVLLPNGGGLRKYLSGR